MQRYFFIRSNGKYVRIEFNEILYVEGCKNYIKIITESKSYLVLVTMKKIEEILPLYLFLRIHKSFIVALERVLEFTTDAVYLKNKELPIGHLYKGALERSVLIANNNLCKLVRVTPNENIDSSFSRAI